MPSYHCDHRRHRNMGPSDPWKLWAVSTNNLPFLTVSMSDTFHAEESLSIRTVWHSFYFLPCQHWPMLFGRAWCWKRDCLHGESDGPMGSEDEAAPWLMGFSLQLISSEMHQQQKPHKNEWSWLLTKGELSFCSTVVPERWHLGMGSLGHFLALPFPVLKVNRTFDQSRKEQLMPFKNRVLSASQRTTTTQFHL